MSEAYRIRSEQTWADARDAYLSGHTAEDVCARYDLGLSAFRARARRNGWRRVDAPDPDPIDLDAPTPLDGMDPSQLAEICLRRVARAIDRNRSSEAMRWMRLHSLLAARSAPASRSQPAGAAVDLASNVHDVHAKNASLDPAGASPVSGPVNRRARRRRAAAERRLSG